MITLTYSFQKANAMIKNSQFASNQNFETNSIQDLPNFKNNSKLSKQNQANICIVNK